MFRKFVLVAGLAGVAMLGACGKKPGEEYVGSWYEGNPKDVVVISRAGDGFDLNKASDKSGPLHGQFVDGRIKIAGMLGGMTLAYDGKRDVIEYYEGPVPGGVLKRAQ